MRHSMLTAKSVGWRYVLSAFWVIGLGCVFAPAWAVEAAHVVKFSPTMRLSTLSARPDTDLVELTDGKRVRLGDLRKIDRAAQKLRAAPTVPIVPPGLRFKPAATGIRLNNADDLLAALKKPDSETVVLPSGRVATVGQLKFVRSRLEARLGHPLGARAGRPNLTGRALKVDKNSDWTQILKKPDATVLESPSGKRVTVGELKHAIMTNQVPPPSTPARKR